MELLLSIMGAAGLGHLAADFFARYERLYDKPFKCNMCMTFWLNVTPFIFLYGWRGVLYAGLASIISELYFKYL